VTRRDKFLGLEKKWQSYWTKCFGFSCIKGITLGAGEEVDEVAKEASGMGVDRIDEVGDRACEG
jgi:hypothetical protein